MFFVVVVKLKASITISGDMLCNFPLFCHTVFIHACIWKDGLQLLVTL